MYRTPANHRPQTLLPGQTCTAKVKRVLRRQQNHNRSLKARTEAKATNPDIRSSLKQPGPQDFGTLIFVTALWGSYNPTIRWLYGTDHPLSPSTLTAIRTVWAAGALAVAIACSNNRSLPAASPSLPDQAHQAEPQGAAGGAAGISQPAVHAACKAELPLLARTVNNVVVAGVELGTYNFLGTSLQAVGLQLTSATRAGFLVQLTAVLVPLLSALAGPGGDSSLLTPHLTPAAWPLTSALGGDLGASSLTHLSQAPAGLLDSAADAGNAGLAGSLLAGSLAQATADLTAAGTSGLEGGSALGATLTQAVVTMAGTGGLAGVGAAMAEQTPLDWLLIIYSALGPGALATYLQTRGQVVVPATLAQVVFSLTPLWSALIAALVLGDDGMGQAAWAGSAAILVASAVATDGQTTTRTQAGAAGREAAAAAAAAAGEGGGAG
ncbi:hypothetical protein V8C86DRAFT_3029043, partial [Haematococcus lacustris]